MKKFYLTALILCTAPLFSTRNNVQIESFQSLNNNIDKIEMHKFYRSSDVKKLVGYKERNFQPFGNPKLIHENMPSFDIPLGENSMQTVFYSLKLKSPEQVTIFYICEDEGKSALWNGLKKQTPLKSKKQKLSIFYFSKEPSLKGAQNVLFESFLKLGAETSFEKTVSVSSGQENHNTSNYLDSNTNLCMYMNFETQSHKKSLINNPLKRKEMDGNNFQSKERLKNPTEKLDELSKKWFKKNKKIMKNKGILPEILFKDRDEEEGTPPIEEEN